MSQPKPPTESIYLPKPTVYSVIGAFIALVSLIGWLRANRGEIARMPVHQRTDTAPIPLAATRPPSSEGGA